MRWKNRIFKATLTRWDSYSKEVDGASQARTWGYFTMSIKRITTHK